jgi:hypothetical protein
MLRPALCLIAILTLLLAPHPSNAQQAEAPVYKDGDWWRIKVDVVRPPGVSLSGPVLERFPEYIVKFESNKLKVFGVQGNDTVEADLPVVIPLILGRPGWLGDMLKFPMRTGLIWSDRVKFQPPGMQMRAVETKYEVQAFEKVKTPKGEFDAFKIVMTMNVPKGPKSLAPTEVRTHTYYYAPDVKAIVIFATSATDLNIASMLTDFSLAK